MLAGRSRVQMKIKLLTDPNTVSGLQWSTREGAPDKIGAGTRLGASGRPGEALSAAEQHQQRQLRPLQAERLVEQTIRPQVQAEVDHAERSSAGPMTWGEARDRYREKGT